MRPSIPFVCLSIFLFASPAAAHPGATDDAGCHVDSRSGKAHCHDGIAKLRKKLKEREQNKPTVEEISELKIEPPKRVTGRVTDVIDGDTIEVIVDGEKWTVRIIGIDCPEKNDNAKCTRDDNCDAEAGARATAKMKELIGGAEVALVAGGKEFKRDRYKRILAYVERDASDAGLELMRGGYCVDYSNRYPHARQIYYKFQLRKMEVDKD